MAGICLTLGKRREIERLYAEDMRPSEIARAVGVTTATIYRELKRGETGELDKRERGRTRAIRLYFPEYLLSVTRRAVVIVKGNADDAVNPTVERGAAGLLPLPALPVGGGSTLPLLGGGALGLLPLTLELAFFHEAVYQHTDTDRIENHE